MKVVVAPLMLFGSYVAVQTVRHGDFLTQPPTFYELMLTLICVPFVLLAGLCLIWLERRYRR